MPTNNEVRSNVIALLRSGIGFGVELFGVLSIDQLEDGRYRILNQTDPTGELSDGKEYIFEDVKKAVDQFIKIRDERRLGYDHEAISPLEELMTHLEDTNITPTKGESGYVNIHGKIPLAVLEKAREDVSRNRRT